MDVVLRPEARLRGLTRYFTGKACKYGHVVERITSSGQCVTCSKEKLQRWRTKFPEKNRDITNKWRANNRELARQYVRRSRMKVVYGISEEDFDQRLEEQHFACAGCLQPFFELPQIDHCHTSGSVRGLLCRPCNWTLGHAKDNPETLIRLATYLEVSGS